MTGTIHRGGPGALAAVIRLADAPLLIVLIRVRWRIPHSRFLPLLPLAAAALP